MVKKSQRRRGSGKSGDGKASKATSASSSSRRTRKPRGTKQSETEPKGKLTVASTLTRTQSAASSRSHSPKVQSICPNHSYRIVPRLIDYIGYGIYVGKALACCRTFLKANKIAHVLSIGEKSHDFNYESSSDKTNLEPGPTARFFEMEDGGPDEDDNAILTAELAKLASIIDACTQGTDTVFVHCQAGYSRSPLAVMTYLHNYKRFTWHEAFVWVGRRRPQMQLHEEFKEYLTKQVAAECKDKEVSFELPGDKQEYWQAMHNKPFLENLNVPFAHVRKDTRPEREIVFSTEEGKQEMLTRKLPTQYQDVARLYNIPY